VIPVKVTRRCLWCGEDVRTDDISYNDGTIHEECLVRSIRGGVNHLRGECACCGGTKPPDPPGLTKREAARLVLSYITTTQNDR
jgi:hypothetical protein